LFELTTTLPAICVTEYSGAPVHPSPESARVGRRPRLPCGAVFLLGLLLVLLQVPAAAWAADPQSYRVELASSGNRRLDTTLRNSSQLIALRKSAPVSPFGLVGRARGDVQRLQTVLESFGYYQGSVSILIDGQPLEQPSLPDHLTVLPRGTDAHCRIEVRLGPLYRLGRIDIDGTVPPEALSALGLRTGAPAVAADVLAGGARLQAALQNQGYAFARVDPPIAYEHPELDFLDLKFHVETGPRVRFGEVSFTGLKHVREAIVRRRVQQLPVGTLYDASQVERARKDLLDLGVFSAVNVELGEAPDSGGLVPITFHLRERLRRVVSLNAAYSSDLGGSGGVTWSNRDLTGRADELRLSATVINLGGSASTSVGYDVNAKYIVPDVGRLNQTMQVSLGALKQSLQAYDQTSETAGVSMRRKLSSVWGVGLGVSAQHSYVIQEAEPHDYTLYALTVSAFYDSTNLATVLDDPLHGLRGTFSVAPTLSIGNPEATFIIYQTTIAGYFDLTELISSTPGYSVLAARFVGGIARGAGEFDLPPDQRFYAGGSGTIRGYRYQSVGPQFPDGNPKGGTALAAVGVELRQRFTPTIGGVLFVDAGQVTESANPTAGEFRVGVGTGVRYYTPIGPIRLDLAFPVRRQPDDDKFEIYLGLGQAF
jgi:translocation and assembly module TamA